RGGCPFLIPEAMMNSITFNVNGGRAAVNKGLREWLLAENADILCLQEIILSETELLEPIFREVGYDCHWYPALKRRYSGVAIISKLTVNQIVKGIGNDIHDAEGRVIMAQFDKFRLISAYFPSGTMGGLRQEVKYKFLEDFSAYVHDLK